MHRYIPAVASWMGVKVAEVPVHHHSRKFGKSKYGISRTIRVILDIITIKYLLSYTRLFKYLGLLVSSLLFVYPDCLSNNNEDILGSSLDRPLFILSIFMIFVGIQL